MKLAIFDFHEVVLLIAIVEMFFLCLVIKKFSKQNAMAKTFFISLFTLLIIAKCSSLLIWNDYFNTTSLATSPLLPALLTMSLLLEGPVLMAYLNRLTYSHRFKLTHVLLHIAPCAIAVSLIFGFHISNLDWLPPNWHKLSPAKWYALKTVWAFYKCIPVLYIGFCYYAEYKLRRVMQDNYSNISSRDISLTHIILAGFSLRWLWSFTGYWLSGYLSVDANLYIGLASNYISIILVNFLFVFGLINGRELIAGTETDEGSFTEHQPIIYDLAKAETIRQTLEIKKPHLENRLNLDRFSELCGLRPREVSFILNAHYKKTFYELINELRVEEAKRLLIEKKNKNILDIALESGFNSHSAFQRFFKRFVGLSPRDYRKQQIN